MNLTAITARERMETHASLLRAYAGYWWHAPQAVERCMTILSLAQR
jgi:hypothetical protein